MVLSFGDKPAGGFGGGRGDRRDDGRPASPWAGRSDSRDFGDSRRSEFAERPRHPEHRTEFPHVAKRSSNHHNAGSGFGGGRSGGDFAGKPRAGRTFNRDR